jgi:hypothetical protein
MRFRNSIVLAGLLLALPALGGCSLEAAMQSCADCGEVRSITPRLVRKDIRLPTLDEALAIADVVDTAGTPVVYHVRVRMDRGGSRDFMLPSAGGLKIGDRVEIRSGALLVRYALAQRWS